VQLIIICVIKICLMKHVLVLSSSQKIKGCHVVMHGVFEDYFVSSVVVNGHKLIENSLSL